MLDSQGFVLTTSLGTLPRPDPDWLRSSLRDLSAAYSVVHFGDNPRARARVSPWAAAALALDEGFTPIVHMSCRDRNRLALEADLLGGLLLGVSTVLCLHGDEMAVAEEPARSVRELDVLGLLALARRVGGGRLTLLAACDPGRPLEPAVLARLRDKLACGATLLEAQPVFDPAVFSRWLDRVRDAGIEAPVLVDVFALASAEQAAAVQRIPFVRAPTELEDRLRRDPAAGVALAAEVVAALRELPGVAGCHVMPLVGDPGPALDVAVRLGLA